MRRFVIILGFVAIAGTVQTFKASWDYNCPAALEIHFKLYIKDGDQWQLIKHFEELFECEIPALGEDYVFGMTAVNREGTESDMVQCTTHVPLLKPEPIQNFSVEVQ